MAANPSPTERVGELSSFFVEAVPAARIQSFAEAVGAQLQDGQASATYLTTCRKGEFEFFERLEVSLARVLHVEQEYSYEAPILGGDLLHYQTELLSAVKKAKGTMLFLVFRTRVEIERPSLAREMNGSRMPAGVSKSTIVVREANEA